jgi:hypothetical protein
MRLRWPRRSPTGTICLTVTVAALGLSGGCRGRGPDAPQTPGGEETTRTDAQAAPEAPTASPAAETPARSASNTTDAREAVLASILGVAADELGSSWQVGSAYDLGSIRIATLERPGDAQAITALSVDAQSAGFTSGELVAAFGGAFDPGAAHPLEVLGYDLVQAQASSAVMVRSREVPRLDYAWLRVDPDSGARENGSGSALWLHCADPGAEPAPIAGRFVLLSAEMNAGRYRSERLLEFAATLPVCGDGR